MHCDLQAAFFPPIKCTIFTLVYKGNRNTRNLPVMKKETRVAKAQQYS